MAEDTENNDEHEDDGITININTGDDEHEDDETEHTETTDEEQDEYDEDFLRDDGTIVLDDDYEGRVRVVGTVHVSKQTRERVNETIDEEEPDVVAIELDDARLSEMFKRGADVVGGEAEDEGDDGFGLRDIIRQQQESQFDGDEFLQSGEADMLPALRLGVDQGSEVALIDMSVDELKDNVKSNAYDESGNLDLEILNKSFSEVTDAVKGLVGSRSNMAEKVQDEGMSAVIDQMENASLEEVKDQMDPLRNVAPEVIQALIDERDQHMAGHIHWLRQNGQDVTAVMGRGHLPGVHEYLQNPDTIPEEYVEKPEWYNYSKVELN